MTEKLKANIQKLFSAGFLHIFGASSINQVFSFLSGIVLVRILPKADYGSFTNALNIYQFFLLFSGFGVSSGLLQLCSEYSDKPVISQMVYRWGSSFGLKANAMLAVIILAATLFIPFPMEGVNSLLGYFCFLPFFTLAYEVCTMKLRGDMRTKTYAYANTINVILYCLLSIGGALLAGSEGLIIGRYIAYASSVLALVRFFGVRPYLSAPKLEPKYKKPLLRVALVSVVNNGLSTLFNILEVFVLGLVVIDSTITASYKVATTIPTALNFVPAAFTVFAYPYFAKHIGEKPWVRRNYLKCLLGLGALNVAITLILFVGADMLVSNLFGQQYMDCVPSFKLLLIGYCIGGTFRTLSGNLLVSQRKLAFNTVVAVVGCVISLIANAALIPIIGSMGAAIAHVLVMVVTSIMNTGCMLYITRSRYKMRGEA